jgi:hypothetical protein
MVMIPESDCAAVESLAIDGGPHPYEEGRMGDFTCNGVHGVKARNLRVANVTVRRWPADGIGVQGGSAIVTGCIAEDCLGYGYHPGTGIQHSIWMGNIGRRNLNGFYFCLGVRNAVVTNNVFIQNRNDGIDGLSDPDAYNVVANNVVAENGRYGINAPQSLGNAITGNVIRDNSRSAPGIFSGLWLDGHSGNVVAGNTFLNTPEAASQKRGMDLGDARGENLVTANLTPPLSQKFVLPKPTAAVKRAAKAPSLDGAADASAWSAAQEMPVDLRVADAKPSAVKTRAAFLRDDRRLYIRIHCEEPLMDRVRDVVRKRNGPVWSENVIEIFLSPGAAGRHCYQLGVNTLGTLGELVHEGGKEVPWESKAQVAVHKDKDSWSVALAIPLEAFGVKRIQRGAIWKANLVRTRTTVLPPEAACWSQVFGGYFQPRRFGKLMFR